MPAIGEPLTLDKTLAGRKLSRNVGLILLNIILSVVQLSSYATGYDGSMMSELLLTEEGSADNIADGLQSLETWQSYFNNPSPATLGM